MEKFEIDKINKIFNEVFEKIMKEEYEKRNRKIIYDDELKLNFIICKKCLYIPKIICDPCFMIHFECYCPKKTQDIRESKYKFMKNNEYLILDFIKDIKNSKFEKIPCNLKNLCCNRDSSDGYCFNCKIWLCKDSYIKHLTTGHSMLLVKPGPIEEERIQNELEKGTLLLNDINEKIRNSNKHINQFKEKYFKPKSWAYNKNYEDFFSLFNTFATTYYLANGKIKEQLAKNIIELIDSPLLKVRFEKDYEGTGSYIRQILVSNPERFGDTIILINTEDDEGDIFPDFNKDSCTFIFDGKIIPYCTKKKVADLGIHELIIKIKEGITFNDLSSDFRYSQFLLYLDLTHFDVSSVTQMFWLFSACKALCYIDMANLDLSNVEALYYNFSWCSSLRGANLSGVKLKKIKCMENLFNSDYALEELDMTGWVFPKERKEVEKMFVTHINYEITEDYFSDNIDRKGMFSECPNLKLIKGFEGFDITELVNLKEDEINKNIKFYWQHDS